ncbi:MAG: hypothetical protein KatS3mg013_1225 [Actinomycetota bacterium]|nr:MAG: hypothetical protein KatS3mg013_1225 [Actinomycetota bacterium]
MDVPGHVIFRLHLVRELLQSAAERAAEGLPTDRMQVVLQLDHSTELLLVTLLPLAGKHPRRQDNLPVLLGQLIEAEPSLASHRPAIERIRRLRDRVQHDGLIPSSEDARTAALETESFARAAVRAILGRELEELTLVSLVKDEEIAERLRRAEEFLKSAHHRAAIEEAAVAFELGSRKILAEAIPLTRALSGRETAGRFLREIGEAARRAASTSRRNPELAEFARRFADELRDREFWLRDLLEPLGRPLLLAELGIPLRDFRRFDEIAPEVVLTVGDDARTYAPEEWTPSREEAAYALDFATRALLVLEKWVEEHPSLRTRRA